MKFGQKLFLVSFITTVVAINLVGIIFINSSFKSNIDDQIDESILVINNIMNSIVYNTTDLGIVAKSYYKNKTYFKVYYGEVMTYTNFIENDEYEKTLLAAPIIDDVDIMIKDEQLYAKMINYNYTIITKTNISDIIYKKDKQIDSFIKMSSIISLFLALILSLVVSLVTAKMKKLNRAAKEVERGNYDITIPKLGKDEIGEFAESFSSMTEAIKNNVRELEELSESRKIFIGNLTHEIRTPLTSIIGYSSLIKTGKVTDIKAIQTYNKKIYEEGKYIESMRDKLMNIMTLETNAIELKSENVSKIVMRTVEQSRTLRKFADIKTSIDPKVYKKCDPDLLKSLVSNLIKNASHSKKDPIINVTLTKNELTIEDDGRGIPKDELERIKEPFYTLNKDRNRKTSGMGLGLPLAFKIVEIHGWTMTINSEVDRGTKITITMEESHEN